ncbi:hypothetical protein LV457_02955 [Mycobacterium sp. MYCO198283]|uniref:hypothetical protein n=1 Tax=Mycobacterium sp. MYCO198283 TaxID=2883505 RepID=UPI001E325EFF|nr:hypothetical protein [Mycobacterium sp. MYCO198283]MCG5431249.1 hypothetical protein [Mycobacterium sp. MYCO198283]
MSVRVGAAPIAFCRRAGAAAYQAGGYQAETDFTTKAVGAFPAASDVGLLSFVKTWNTSSAADPGISNPGDGPRYTIGATAASAQAGYATHNLGADVTYMSSVFSTRGGSTTGYNLALVAWTDPMPSGALSQISTQQSPCHCPFLNTGYQLATFERSGGVQVRASRTYATAIGNGVTQAVSCKINRATATITVVGADGISTDHTHPNFAYAGQYACCEIYYNNASTDRRVEVSNFKATSAANGQPGAGGWVTTISLAKAIYLWATKAWPLAFVDTFNRADAADVGAPWVGHMNGFKILSNQAVGKVLGSGSNSNSMHCDIARDSDDHYIRVILGTTVPQAFALSIRGDNSTRITSYHQATGSQSSIRTSTEVSNWSPLSGNTQRAASTGNVAFAPGDEVLLGAIGTTYFTVKRTAAEVAANAAGTVLAKWTDTGGAAWGANVGAAKRKCGVWEQGTTASMGFDSIEIGDYPAGATAPT